MKRWKAFLLVGLTTMGFQMWSWFWPALAAIFGILGQGYNMYKGHKAGQYAQTANEQARLEAMRPNEPYRRSEFMPGESEDYSPMARYAPQNRQPSSGVDPQLMQYLRSFTSRR